MNINEIKLPQLKPSERSREYKYYPDGRKAKVISEHLINNRTHRWLDINVLEIAHGKTNGRTSANILYFLGMKADYRGIFQGYDLIEVIEYLESLGSNYKEIVRLLKLIDNLDITINNDLESEKFEEGFGVEGEARYYYGKKYERVAKNRKLAIEIHGLNCFACGFNFEKMYGDHGKNFIEIHHVKPLSTLNTAMNINPEVDLIPLCANCHRMIHREKNNVLSLEELKEILTE